MLSVDKLAQFIRQIDGDHTMGSGRLAEEILGSDWFAGEMRKAKAEALWGAAESADFEVGYSLQRWLKSRAKREEKAP